MHRIFNSLLLREPTANESSRWQSVSKKESMLPPNSCPDTYLKRIRTETLAVLLVIPECSTSLAYLQRVDAQKGNTRGSQNRSCNTGITRAEASRCVPRCIFLCSNGIPIRWHGQLVGRARSYIPVLRSGAINEQSRVPQPSGSTCRKVSRGLVASTPGESFAGEVTPCRELKVCGFLGFALRVRVIQEQ
jgi:hypothetical protein